MPSVSHGFCASMVLSASSSRGRPALARVDGAVGAEVFGGVFAVSTGEEGETVLMIDDRVGAVAVRAAEADFEAVRHKPQCFSPQVRHFAASIMR